MPTPIDPKRIENLNSALKSHKADELLSLLDLGKIYGVSHQRMSALIKNVFDYFPKPQKQSDAKKDYYPAGSAIQAMIDYCEKTGIKQKKKKNAVSQIMQGNSSSQSVDLTASDIDRLMNAATKQWRLEKEMGEYIKYKDAVAGYRSIYELVRNEMMGWITKVDPNGKIFNDETRKKLDEQIRQSLLKLHDNIKDMGIGSAEE